VIPEEARKNEIVSITGLANRQPKEVSCFVLSQVIHARMKEILDFVEAEIENSGYRNRLAAGVVITGGGSLLKNLQKLVSYQLAMECRLGTPNMHLAGDNKEYLNPSYATGIGLLMKGIEDEERKMKKEKEQPELSTENESQKKLEKERWSLMNIINNLKNITEDWIKHDLD
jgi:cell division protein FtsA